MYFSILLLPFLSFMSTNLLGSFIGIYGSCLLSTISIFASFVLSLVAFYESVICSSTCALNTCFWFQSELLMSSWGFYFDTMAMVMLLVVTGVSCLVHLYSIDYMSSDPFQGRFMGYLSLFTGFMLILVTSDNFMVMFFGWEGIGLASFLLIGFWYTSIQAGKSAIKAMLVNSVGDLGLALAMSAMFLTFKTIDYSTVFALVPSAMNSKFSFFLFELDRLTVMSLLLFWGAVGKSAQIGLHIWLPDAMEGPTPVSALMHAATLVTAGVFLIISCSIIFENSNSLFIMAMIGSLTAFFASSVGLVQNDIKSVIAYSTCSQLGYMVFAAGLSNYSISFFHLYNHALFKALLFLSAGSMIHGLADEQDMSKMGSLMQFFPVTYMMMLIGSLALMGFPFLTGFYSKDAILEIAMSKNNLLGHFTHFLGCMAAFCTSFYSFSLIFMVFMNDTNVMKSNMPLIHESSMRMIMPLMLLAFGAMFIGYLSKDMFIGLGSSFFSNSMYFNSFGFNHLDSEFLMAFFKNMPFLFTLIGGIFSAILINGISLSKTKIYSLKISKSFSYVYTLLTQKWHFDQMVNEIFVIKTMNFGYSSSFQLMDKGNIELFGPVGIAFYLKKMTKSVSFMQTGWMYHYCLMLITSFLFSMLLGMMIMTDLWCLLDVTFFSILLGYSFFTWK